MRARREGEARGPFSRQRTVAAVSLSRVRLLPSTRVVDVLDRA